MRFAVFSFAVLFLVRSSVAAEPAKDASYVADEYRVQLIEQTARRKLPEEITKDSDWKPGFELGFLIEGPRIAKLSPFGLKLDTLRTKSGRDIRQVNGRDNYRDGMFMSNFSKEKYQCFKIVSDEADFEDLSALQVRGTIEAQVAEASEVVRTEKLDLTKPAKFQFRGFNIILQGKQASPPNPFSGLLGELEKELGPDAGGETVSFQIDVPSVNQLPLLDTVAKVRLVSGEKSMSWRYQGRGATLDYEFEKPADGHGVIELTLWQGIHEVAIPFNHNIEPLPGARPVRLPPPHIPRAPFLP